MFEAIAYLLMVPIDLIRVLGGFAGAWGGAGRPYDPRALELTRASYGAVMLVIAGWLSVQKTPWLNVTYKMPVLTLLIFWGIFCLAIGAARSKGPRDMLLLTMALLRLAVGVILYGLRLRLPHDTQMEYFAYRGLSFLALFLMITGFVKVFLLLRGQPSVTQGRRVAGMQHGDANFDRGGELRWSEGYDHPVYLAFKKKSDEAGALAEQWEDANKADAKSKDPAVRIRAMTGGHNDLYERFHAAHLEAEKLYEEWKPIKKVIDRAAVADIKQKAKSKLMFWRR